MAFKIIYIFKDTLKINIFKVSYGVYYQTLGVTKSDIAYLQKASGIKDHFR